MFGAVSRFREVCISAFDTRILIAVPELLGESEVPVVMVLFTFGGTLSAVRIVVGDFIHDELFLVPGKAIVPAGPRAKLLTFAAVRGPAELR